MIPQMWEKDFPFLRIGGKVYVAFRTESDL